MVRKPEKMTLVGTQCGTLLSRCSPEATNHLMNAGCPTSRPICEKWDSFDLNTA
jgi:hypothetical protein